MMKHTVSKDDIADPQIYLRWADAYVAAADIVVGQIGSLDNLLSLPTANLLSNSLELSLKGFLLHAGMAPADVRKINHDLTCALNRALALGLQLEEMCELDYATKKLRPIHMRNTARYPQRGKVGLGNMTRILCAVRKTSEQVRAIVSSGAVSGHGP